MVGVCAQRPTPPPRTLNTQQEFGARRGDTFSVVVTLGGQQRTSRAALAMAAPDAADVNAADLDAVDPEVADPNASGPKWDEEIDFEGSLQDLLDLDALRIDLYAGGSPHDPVGQITVSIEQAVMRRRPGGGSSDGGRAGPDPMEGRAEDASSEGAISQEAVNPNDLFEMTRFYSVPLEGGPGASLAYMRACAREEDPLVGGSTRGRMPRFPGAYPGPFSLRILSHPTLSYPT